MRVGKVFRNIEESNYNYSYKRFTFTFSSKFYINKFTKELNSYINNETNKLSKYNLYLESDEFLALSLYKKIEKRGFLVIYNEEGSSKRFIKENETFIISISALKYL